MGHGMWKGGSENERHIRSVVIVILCLLLAISVSDILHNTVMEKKEIDASGALRFLGGRVTENLIPYFSFSEEKRLPDNAAAAVFLYAEREFPVWHCSDSTGKNSIITQSSSTYEMILALEGADEDNHTVYAEVNNLEAMEAENRIARGEDVSTVQETDVAAGSESLYISQEPDTAVESGNAEVAESGQEVPVDVQTTAPGQVPLRTTPAFTYDFSKYQSLESLVKGFYIVDPTTAVTEERLNLDNLLGTDVSIHGDNTSPQILIYHTHSQEGYADSVIGDPDNGVMGAGEYLAQILTQQYGYQVIHHTGQYDVADRDHAYSVAAPALEQLLAQYPTIEVVIDLHRDEVRDEVHLVTDIDGHSCAKFMFFNGLSYSNTLGDISYLNNPYMRENLAFSFQAQVLVNEYYPGLSRGIYLRAYRYNMHFIGKTMLLELGAQNNTEEEIRNTVPLIAQILDQVFRGVVYNDSDF